MKYNWPAVVDEFRKILLENIILPGEFKEHFRFAIINTDTFHPFGTDRELARALGQVPISCNYRNIDSYHAWKNRKEPIDDALYSMMEAVWGEIQEYYSDTWNFPPRTILPNCIGQRTDFSEVATASVSRILRAARKS